MNTPLAILAAWLSVLALYLPMRTLDHERVVVPTTYRVAVRSTRYDRCMSVYRSIAALATAVLLAACGSGSGAGPSVTTVDLRIEFRADTGRDLETATLQCERTEMATGFLAARAPAACDLVADHKALLTAQPDPRRACTLIYGGPEVARVTGTVDGQSVDRGFHRTDGCGISDWNEMKALIDPRP